MMDSSKPECLQRTLRVAGQSFRFPHQRFDQDPNLESFGIQYSGRGNNNEMWSRRPIARQSDYGNGDSERVYPLRPRWRSMPNRLLIVHGLERMAINCDNVFNLFCLYGNVTAIKILKGKQVLVELEDAEAAKRCMSHLNLLRLDQTTKLDVKYSKLSSIYDHGTSSTFSAYGTHTQQNYMASKFNRFPAKGMKYTDQRRTAVPSKILHFYNAPLDVCASMIHKTVTEALGCTDAIRSITILPKKLPGAKCSTGLIEFKSIELAAKTIFLLNHMFIESSHSSLPILIKLCFSKWSDIRQMSLGSLNLLCSTTPRKPCFLQKSKNAAPNVTTVTFLVVRTTLHVNCRGDTSWTLWEMRNIVTEAIDPVAGNLVEPINTVTCQAGQPRRHYF